MKGNRRTYSAAEYASWIRICGQILLSPLISDDEYRGMLGKYKQQAMQIEKSLERKRRCCCISCVTGNDLEPEPMDRSNTSKDCYPEDMSDEQASSMEVGSLGSSCTVLGAASQPREVLVSEDLPVKDSNNNKSGDKNVLLSHEDSALSHSSENVDFNGGNLTVLLQPSEDEGFRDDRQSVLAQSSDTEDFCEQKQAVSPQSSVIDDSFGERQSVTAHSSDHGNCSSEIDPALALSTEREVFPDRVYSAPNQSPEYEVSPTDEHIASPRSLEHEPPEVLQSSEQKDSCSEGGNVLEQSSKLGDSSEEICIATAQSPELDNSNSSPVTEQSGIPRLQRQGTFVLDAPSPVLLKQAKVLDQGHNEPVNPGQADTVPGHASSTPLFDSNSISLSFEVSSGKTEPKISSEEEDREKTDLVSYNRNREIVLKKLEEKQERETVRLQEQHRFEKCLLTKYLENYSMTGEMAPKPEQDLTSEEIAHANRLLSDIGVVADIPNASEMKFCNWDGNSTDVHNDTTCTEDIFMLDHDASREDCSRLDDAPTLENLSRGPGSSRVSLSETINAEEVNHKIEQAASKINAAARGYLTRKLMRSSHVKSIMELITSTVEFALKLQKDSEANLVPSDVQLHGRLIGQVTAACNELYDIFFNKSARERMLIIAADRKKKTKSPMEKSLSSATLKVIKRKQMMTSQTDSEDDFGEKQDFGGREHFQYADVSPRSSVFEAQGAKERERSPPSSPSPNKTLRRSSGRSPPDSPSRTKVLRRSSVRSSSYSPSPTRRMQTVRSPHLSVTSESLSSSVRSPLHSPAPQACMHSGHSPSESSPPAACEFRSVPKTPPRRKHASRSHDGNCPKNCK